MSFDERLFGAAQRALRRWRDRRRDGVTEVVELDAASDALRHFACLLTGRAIEVRSAEHDGEILGDLLLLPARMAIADSAALNADAYVYRVAYSTTSQALGFHAHAFRADLPNTLASLLAVPVTVDALEAVWPGAVELRRRLSTAILEGRSKSRSAVSRARDTAAVAGLYAAILGMPREALAAEQDAETLEWLDRAASVRPEPDQLEAETSELIGALPRTRGRRRTHPARIELPLFGRLSSRSARTIPSAPGPAPAAVEKPGSLEPTTERPGKNRDRVERIEVDQNPESANPLVHVFEKLFTAEEYQGGRKSLDGSDELTEHADALDELGLRKVVRADEPTASLYRADIVLDDTVVDTTAAEDPGIPTAVYDEWDDRKRRYRSAWCRVFEAPAPVRVTTAQTTSTVRTIRQRYAAQIREIRAAFEHLERQRALRCRQPDGTDIDLDAIVDRFAALRAAAQHGGEVTDDRLYTARRRHARDSATLILLDTSMSTDSWVDGRRVLDVARESAIVLGEVLDSCLGVRTSIGAFHSETRHSCRYEVVKGFDSPWKSCHGRLLSLRPTGYTRIGPAIRHATALLAAEPARQKLLLLLSDGKPTDYDRYEGRYGIADVRQALREATRLQIRSFALTVETGGKFYLPQMFGARGFRVMQQPSELPRSLAMLHQELV